MNAIYIRMVAQMNFRKIEILWPKKTSISVEKNAQTPRKCVSFEFKWLLHLSPKRDSIENRHVAFFAADVFFQPWK